MTLAEFKACAATSTNVVTMMLADMGRQDAEADA